MNSISVQTWLNDPKYSEIRKQYYGVTLNCGHLPSDPTFVYDTGYTMTTGYGTHDGKRYCHDCCAEMDRKAMKRDGRADLYLSERGNQLVVSTWPGRLFLSASRQLIPGETISGIRELRCGSVTTARFGRELVLVWECCSGAGEPDFTVWRDNSCLTKATKFGCARTVMSTRKAVTTAALVSKTSVSAGRGVAGRIQWTRPTTTG